MAKNDRHVVKNARGTWDVKAGGAKRASAKEKTQAAAEKTAKKIVGNAGGGEVVIHGRDGRIRERTRSRRAATRIPQRTGGTDPPPDLRRDVPVGRLGALRQRP